MNKELIVKYDYSDIVPTKDRVLYVIEYMARVYDQLILLMNEDEEKNKMYSAAFKDYKYKNSYKKQFTVLITHKNFGSDIYDTYSEFLNAVNSGKLSNLSKIKVTLDMSFKRGKESSLEEHDNLIIFEIKPYDVFISRDSNMDDMEVNEVFNTIKSLLDQFDKQETIFNIK